MWHPPGHPPLGPPVLPLSTLSPPSWSAAPLPFLSRVYRQGSLQQPCPMKIQRFHQLLGQLQSQLLPSCQVSKLIHPLLPVHIGCSQHDWSTLGSDTKVYSACYAASMPIYKSCGQESMLPPLAWRVCIILSRKHAFISHLLSQSFMRSLHTSSPPFPSWGGMHNPKPSIKLTWCPQPPLIP